MKYKTTKLRKLEQDRYSIFTEDLDHCFLCGATGTDIHEIYGGSNRQQSMKYGFCVPLCRFHHSLVTLYPKYNNILQKECQEIYEVKHSREEFMRIIGKNYL